MHLTSNDYENSHIFLLKGEAPVATTSLSSCSSIATIARHKLSSRMFRIPCEFTSYRTLCVVDCCGQSCSLLLLRVSCMSAPLPNLLNTFP